MYFAPYIDASGVHLPTYQDRLDTLVSSYQTIFGPEASLEISSPDYQLLSVFARALDDLGQLLLYGFVSRNPDYAVGTALDLLMPLFGLHREGATFSRVPLTLTGEPNAVLPAAPQVMDDASHIWACQTAGIRLDASGSATVEAICSTPGAVTAPIGSVHQLISPVAGLSYAVNSAAATPGREAESDASCRSRLKLAAAAPAVTTLDALKSAIAAVPNVQSSAIYVNDSESTDSRGIPPHSLCVVVLGGLTATLARTIFEKKAPGIGTYGTLSADVTDAFGETHTIHLQRAAPVPVALSIELTPLAGFDSSVTERIRTALTEYSNSLQIGQNIVVPSLYGLCYGADPAPSPTFSISLLSATAQGTSTSGVVSAAWNQRLMIPANMIQILVAG